MRHDAGHAERLIRAYSDEYMAKLFYFCLKKTGNPAEAEDLASDITVNILSALHKGVVPEHFSAWVWRIARNRYSVWSAKKHRRDEALSAVDIDLLDIADGRSAEGEFLRQESLKLLLRELAFISKEYREIVTAYYVHDRKVGDISKTLGLPEGTVKSKLFHSRRILKEGMSMAREFGVRSYKPEDVNFVASGSQPSGLPWKAVSRQIPKNILLQAHNNPSTIEELSVELGIAAPYMEEEVELLVDATLMKQLGGKYITSFFVADKECQAAVYKAQRRDSKERSRLIDRIVGDSMPELEKLNILRNGKSFGLLKLLLLALTADFLLDSNPDSSAIEKGFSRPDGGSWGFMGEERHDLIPEPLRLDCTGEGGEGAVYLAYTFSIDGKWALNRPLMTRAQAILLADIIKNNRRLPSLTDAECKIWKDIDWRYAHADKAGSIIPDIAVFEGGRVKLNAVVKAHPRYAEAEKMIAGLYGEVREILKAYSNPVLHEHIDYYVSMMMFRIRMMLIHDEIDDGRLTVPEESERNSLTALIEVY